MAMRGLTVFISDLRNCTNPEQERKRVEKEMAHIRSKFTVGPLRCPPLTHPLAHFASARAASPLCNAPSLRRQ